MKVQVLYLDKLGQLALRNDDHNLAMNAFQRAYEMSIYACGYNAPLTLKQKDMYENPPTSVNDLLSRYQTTAHQMKDKSEIIISEDATVDVEKDTIIDDWLC